MIFKKALQYIPDDLEIWKEAIALEDEAGAKKMLEKAVQCLPEQTELWLALAKLQPYEKAKEILN